MAEKQDLDRPGCDTSEMLLVHRLFRRSFGEAPDLVRAVRDGDLARSQAVGEHLLLLAKSLHGHHETEDSLLWDQLSSRSPSCSIHVSLMRKQHERIGRGLADLEAAVPRWRSAPSADTAAPVLDALAALQAGLDEHLGDEERLILPPAGRTLTQREWNRLGEHARAATPRNLMFVQLGFLLDALDPAERADFERHALPAPARVLFRLVGKRQYRDYRRKVYGTAA